MLLHYYKKCTFITRLKTVVEKCGEVCGKRVERGKRKKKPEILD